MIAGLDAGNYETKVCSGEKVSRLLSQLGEYRQRTLEQNFGDDIVYEFNGKKGFAGTLAAMESEFSASMVGETKAHEETLIRVLLGLNKHAPQEDTFKVVIGQPISMHDAEQKRRLREMLNGSHAITVNGHDRVITIEDVEVGAEGGAAFWSSPKRGLQRIIDFGSGTVNYATLLDGKYIDKDSGTLPFGVNTTKSNDLERMVRFVCIETLKKWSKRDEVSICGGIAPEVLSLVQNYYFNARVLIPRFTIDGKPTPLEPVYANAVGLYNIARSVYR